MYLGSMRSQSIKVTFLLRRRQDFDKQNFNQALLALKKEIDLVRSTLKTVTQTDCSIERKLQTKQIQTKRSPWNY